MVAEPKVNILSLETSWVTFKFLINCVCVFKQSFIKPVGRGKIQQRREMTGIITTIGERMRKVSEN